MTVIKGVLAGTILICLQFCVIARVFEDAGNPQGWGLMVGAVALSVAAGLFVTRTEWAAARARAVDDTSG